MNDYEAKEKVEKLYLSWKERVGRDKANMMMGVLVMAMVMSSRGCDDDEVAGSFEEALKEIIGLEVFSRGELKQGPFTHEERKNV